MEPSTTFLDAKGALIGSGHENLYTFAPTDTSLYMNVSDSIPTALGSIRMVLYDEPLTITFMAYLSDR